MKKIQLGLAIIGLGLASSTVFAAADGTVTVTGKIVDQTCTVGGTAGNYTVVLPTVGKSTLATAATTNGDTKFTINLTACPVGNVGVYYDNTNANINYCRSFKQYRNHWRCNKRKYSIIELCKSSD